MISLQESIGSDGDSYHQMLPPGTFILHNRIFNCPSLVRRYKAMAIDSLVLLTTMIVTMLLVGDNENSPTIMISLAIVLRFYEPLLSRYSATVGQRLMKIRVRDYNAPSQPVRFWQAYIRLLTKGFLGWL